MTIYDYAEVGGTPIINNALTYYYVQNQDCPFDRITANCACPTLLGLPGGIPNNPTIQQAPWYDPSQPDLSSRFFGVYGWRFTGLGDTNRSAQIVEGLDDGAWMGRTRRTARQVRVEGMLIAKGQDALDYGLAWLSAALDGDRCGQHAAACGVTDFEFFTTCPPERGVVIEDGEERPETNEEYAERVDPLRRYLHEVVCTSGPLRKRESARDDWNMMDVEFTLTAGRPWIFEAMRHPDLPTTGTTVIEDTAHNLVPYTSAELGGALQTIARNFSTNPSVETNATGWSVVTDGVAITPAMVVGARVTGELAANGAASYRTVFTATGAGAAAGWFGAQQEVNFSGRPADAPISINMWAAEVLMAGTPVRTDITFTAIWRNGGTEVSREVIGTVPVDGGANSVRSLIPPATATSVIVRAQARLTSWPAGTILRMYADALAVTVP